MTLVFGITVLITAVKSFIVQAQVSNLFSFLYLSLGLLLDKLECLYNKFEKEF
jgi:hypothetical protein